MDKPKRKKKYYIPGIISLLLLPWTFIYFAQRKIRQSTTWAIPIYWADTAILKKFEFGFEKYAGQFPPKRNYTVISYSGNSLEDKIRLSYAQIRIREILKGEDTLNGIHFIFGESANYGTFVETVDILRLEGAKTYMPMENNLWFYCFKKDTITRSSSFNCLLIDDEVSFIPKASWWIELKTYVMHIWQTSWQIVLLFFCFAASVFVQMLPSRNVKY